MPTLKRKINQGQVSINSIRKAMFQNNQQTEKSYMVRYRPPSNNFDPRNVIGYVITCVKINSEFFKAFEFFN